MPSVPGFPRCGLFLALVGAWLILFHFLGNSTLGYVDTPSLFGWLTWMYSRSPEEDHLWLIPFLVGGLMWWKREELMSVDKRVWWPALALVVVGVVLHVLGFVVQQTRVSVVAFFVGLYGLMGVVWGPAFLRASFFPWFLFCFSVPLGNSIEFVTFPLRMLATTITTGMCHTILGLDVIRDGTRIFDPAGAYQYEVAVACSGLRSLTVTIVLACTYAFMSFNSVGKRLILIASAVPLAVVANVFRLSAIIIAAELMGQEAGNFVHENFFLSLLPYVPAMLGLMILGRFLERRGSATTEPVGDAKEVAA